MENMLYLLNMSISGVKNIKEEIRNDFYKKQLIRILTLTDIELKQFMVKTVPENLPLLQP